MPPERLADELLEFAPVEGRDAVETSAGLEQSGTLAAAKVGDTGGDPAQDQDRPRQRR